MDDDIDTGAENTWCPGCGNFGILNAVEKAVKILEDDEISRDRLLITAGIGCHGKIFDYLDVSGLYSIHGRGVATAEGIKLGNPDLNVIAFAGDGDAYGEGLAHLIFAAKRNADITLVVHNNGVYALTTGQVSPTSKEGYVGPSTPEGSVEEPLEPLSLLLTAGATFVARGYAGKIDHLTELLVKGIKHQGFAVIDVLQPSVVFNDKYKEYNERTVVIDEVADDHKKAIELTRVNDKIPLGIFYQHKKATFEKLVCRERISCEEKKKAVGLILRGDD